MWTHCYCRYAKSKIKSSASHPLCQTPAVASDSSATELTRPRIRVSTLHDASLLLLYWSNLPLTNYHVHYTTGFLQLCERLFPSLSYPSLFHTPRSLIPQAGHYILGRIYLLGSSVPTTSWLPCGSQVSIKVWMDVGYINWPISCTLSRNYTYNYMYLCSIVFDSLRLQWMVLYLLGFSL